MDTLQIEQEATERNAFQKVSDATHTIVTPANAIDAAAFVVAMQGIRDHDTWQGIAKSGIGYLADMVDGRIARATGTQSALGEAVDATGDKLKLGYAIIQLWQSERAPRPLLAAVAIQNGTNAAISLYDRKTNDVPQVHPTRDGKRAYAAQEFGIGLHVIGSKVAETAPRAGKAMKLAGSVLGWAGVLRGFSKSTPAYWREAKTTSNEAAAPLDKTPVGFPRALPTK